MSNPQVLIAGAGPAGLIMALYLVQSGIKPRVIDKAANHRIGSRGFGIQPRTFELFHFLGLVEDVLKAAMPVPTMRAYKLPGGTEPVKTWDMYEKNEGTWPDRPYPNGACLSQSTLEEVMRKHLARYDIDIELSHELVGLEQTRESVTAIIVNHSSGACETVDFPYVIGADGAKGSSRKLLGLTFEGETRDADSMLWADVEIQGLTSDFWHCWGKPGQFTIMARPLDASANNHQFGVGVVGHNFDVSGLTEPEKLQEFIINETGRSDLDFGQFSWISYFRPNMRVVNKFHVGRVFLVGDAAHVHPPTGGQGMNCSIQDSSNLAWKLALVLKGRSPPSLLSSYDIERLPVITQMLHATTQLYTHVVAKESQSVPSELEVRDGGKESGWFRWRNNALFLFGVNYRFSGLVLEERDTLPQDHETARARAYQGYENMPSVLRAGDRAPDAPVLVSTLDGHSTSLFALLRSYLHTVVVFPGENQPTDEILAVCREYPSEIVQTIVISGVSVNGLNVLGFVDQNGHARRAYRARGDGTDVVIIRPDGFIGAIVCNANGLTRYFSKILH